MTTPGVPTPPPIDGLLGDHRVVPVVVADDVDCAGPLAAALQGGGLPIAEVTLRTDAALGVIEALAAVPELLVGVGTVTAPDDVDRAVSAGARFVVSPGLSVAIARRCAEHAVPYLPGVATATEVMQALELGITTLKLYPAELLGGPRAAKELAGPFPGVRFVPTGGVREDTAPDYLAQPSVVAVGGTWVTPRRDLAAGRFEDIRRSVAAASTLGGPR